MDRDSPAYGDERERAVFMESNVFGLAIGIYVGLLAAVVAALFGLLLLPVILFAVATLSAVASLWYAKQRAVNPRELADNAGALSTMMNAVVGGAALMVASAAMGFTVQTGQSVLSFPRLTVTPGEGFLGGLAEGAPIGGVLGGLAALLGGIQGYRRAKRARREP